MSGITDADVSIACVMVSPAGPLARIKEAIRAFTAQTYTRGRRTLIVALRHDAPQRDAIARCLASIADDDADEAARIRLHLSPRPSIEAVVAETTTDLICEWSPSVHQHETRLAVQIALMRKLGARASAFADWIWWHTPAREIYWCEVWPANDGTRMPGLEASLIAERDAFCAYRESDAAFDDVARLTDAGALMVSRIDDATLPASVTAHAKTVTYVREHRHLLRGVLPSLRLSRPYLLRARLDESELVALDPLCED